MSTASKRDDSTAQSSEPNILLQKILIIAVILLYAGQMGITIYRERGYSQAVLEALFITLTPVIFFAVAYALRTRTTPQVLRIAQSLIVAVVTYMFWILSLSVAQLLFWHTIGARFSGYAITGAFSVVVLAAVLIYLKQLKVW